MTTDSYPLRLYIRRRQTSVLVLTPASDGYPEVVTPTPPLFRAAYLNPPITNETVTNAYSQLSNPRVQLLMLFGPSPDGPPFRSGVVFTYYATGKITYRDGSTTGHGKEADEYLASTQASSDVWTSDARYKTEGYFLTGAPDQSNLWHVERMEIDVANRCVFTLAPVELAAGLPRVTFESITDPVLRQEAENHWSDVQAPLVRHRYYPLVTAAKNLAETLLVYYLRGAGVTVPRELAKMLEKLREMLEAKQAAPYGYLDYHLMHKLRLLHGWTHPGAVSQKGHALTPRLALSAIEDLIEVLTRLELVAKP